MYSIKEMFYSLQGEGARTGRPAVFCRFAGCNLWSGREQDRSKAVCNFCDTDFIGTDGINGGKFADAEALAAAVLALWPDASAGKPYVICTGGEPLLQLDSDLIEAFKALGFEVAVETNGTLPAPAGIDWICVSPKGTAEVVLTAGHELKLVYPQADAMPERFNGLNFEYFYLQPKDGDTLNYTSDCVAYCQSHPQWHLSLQTHKLLGIP